MAINVGAMKTQAIQDFDLTGLTPPGRTIAASNHHGAAISAAP
jgi:hypothetical protein